METDHTHSKIQEIIQEHKNRLTASDNYQWGYRFTVFKDVFSPFIAPSGRLGLTFASLPDFRGKRVLDVGCGSGVIACLMALNGASKVVGIDINPSAIENAEKNSSNLKLTDKLEFRLGSLLTPVQKEESFDIVYADLPFTDGIPNDILEAAFYDPQLNSIKALIDTFPTVRGLQNAKLYLAISAADANELKSVAVLLQLSWNDFISHKLPWINLQITELHRDEDSV